VNDGYADEEKEKSVKADAEVEGSGKKRDEEDVVLADDAAEAEKPAIFSFRRLFPTVTAGCSAILAVRN
jgi:hypothetical protein